VLRDLPPVRRRIVAGDRVRDRAGVEYIVAGPPGLRYIPVVRADGELLSGGYKQGSLHVREATLIENPAPVSSKPKTLDEEFLGED
jgi:hypothetical protein